MQKIKLRLETPRWAKPLADADYSRYRGAFGGRASGKSWFFAESMIERHYVQRPTYSVCIREIQKDLRHSAKRLLEIQIDRLNMGPFFDVMQNQIRTPGDGLIIFQGMQNHNAESIKSLESYDIAWIEEAQNISQRSLDLLRPTIRKDKSEIWATWNPRHETDPIDQLLRGQKIPKNSIVCETNFRDNPWFPDIMRDEMEYYRNYYPDRYAHIWLGDYIKHTDALVFRNWKVEEFETASAVTFRFGADWGFSVDPTVLVRSYVSGRKLFVDYEAYQIGCEILDIPDLFRTVPESDKWPIIADSQRPDTISHLRNHGFPKIYPAVKGAKSLEEGVEWLKTFEIIVHPRCQHLIDELSLYSYKIDKESEKVLPVLDDRDNHLIDSLRYAHEGLRRADKIRQQQSSTQHSSPIPINNPYAK